MLDRMLALDGPRAFLAWISLANVIIGTVSLIVSATPQIVPPHPGASLTFRTSFVLVYGRSLYRTVLGSPITYVGAVPHLLIGLALVWGIVTSVRDKRAVMRAERAARIAHRTHGAT